jgi:uncharacterized protein
VQATILEPSILININRTFKKDMSETDLYEATRKSWVVAPNQHDPQPRYALSVFKGIVRQVYEIQSWLPSPTRPGRLLFEGVVAADKAHYVGKSVQHIKPRSANPIKYVNC